ncbi:MAG TPA: twin-arginine translocase TatA/TatE family subunit [Candidatus Aquilonibacter sp.]
MSIPDIGIISILALLLFGPDRLPGILRQAGRIMREVQNTSHSFVAEMERAADINERPTQPTFVESLPEAPLEVEGPTRPDPSP